MASWIAECSLQPQRYWLSPIGVFGRFVTLLRRVCAAAGLPAVCVLRDQVRAQ